MVAEKNKSFEESTKGNKIIKSVTNVVSGSFLTEESTLKNFPFVFFLSLMAICYIAYGYYSDDQIRKVNRLNGEIKELRTQFIVAKDSLVIKTKQTQVAQSLSHLQIKESVVPPQKIKVNKNNNLY